MLADSKCVSCGAGRLEAHMSVRGAIGEQSLIPSSDRFGTALADIVRCPRCGQPVAGPPRAMGRRWWSVLPTHVQYFTRGSMVTLLRCSGFEVLEVGTAPSARPGRPPRRRGQAEQDTDYGALRKQQAFAGEAAHVGTVQGA